MAEFLAERGNPHRHARGSKENRNVAKGGLFILHNPRCGKSREDALKLLQGAGIEVEAIEYLKTPPTAAPTSKPS